LSEVKLYITPVENDQYLVVVNGEGFFNAENAEVGVRLRGEDTWFDDDLFTLRLGFPGHVLNGTFSMSAIVPGSSLDEDWGEDEVYALVSIEGAGEFKTNTIIRHF